MEKTHALQFGQTDILGAAPSLLPWCRTATSYPDRRKEVARTLAAFEQAIEDLGEIAGDDDAPVHVRLGAISRMFDAHERRLRLMASAGFMSRNLAALLVEQEMAAWSQGVAEILRRHNVGDEVIGELVTMARQRLRTSQSLWRARPTCQSDWPRGSVRTWFITRRP